MRPCLKHVEPEEIPASEDLFSAEELKERLDALREPPLSLIACGDLMLGGRAKRAIADHGADYPFEAVLPILRQAAVVLRTWKVRSHGRPGECAERIRTGSTQHS